MEQNGNNPHPPGAGAAEQPAGATATARVSADTSAGQREDAPLPQQAGSPDWSRKPPTAPPDGGWAD